MMDHRKEAEEFLEGALDVRSDWASTTALASTATAHATLAVNESVRALIDLISGDREDEIEEANRRIADLEFQLEGCRNALRQREDAMAASMEQQQEDATNQMPGYVQGIATTPKPQQEPDLNELAMQYRELYPDYEPTAAELREWDRDRKASDEGS